jgi:hypothetical protein
MPRRIVKRIKREQENNPECVLESPLKRQLLKKKVEVDIFDRNIIHMTVEDFYIRLKVVPSVRKLLIAVEQSLEFLWKKDVLIWILCDMGFGWKCCCEQEEGAC